MKSISNDKIIYISGQLVFLATIFVVNTLTARMLGPYNMGIWNLVNMFADYGFFVTAGIINGMARELPFNVGKSNFSAVNNITYNCAVDMLLIVILLLFTMFGIAIVDVDRSMIYYMSIVLLIFRIVSSYTYILIRSWQDFSYLGIQQLVMAFFQTIGIAILLYSANLSTVLVITAGPLFIGSLFAYKYFKRLQACKFDKTITITLFKTGFPIYMVGILFSLYATTDRLLIVRFLGVDQLGLYTPAMIAVSVTSLVPTFASNIMFPKIAELYGGTSNLETLMPYVKKMININMISTFVTAVLFFLSFYFVVIPYFLPAFQAGVVPMGIILLASVISAIGHGFGDLFNVIGRQRVYLVNIATSLVINALSGYLLLTFTDLGLTGVTIGTLFSVIIYSTMQVCTVKRIMGADQR